MWRVGISVLHNTYFAGDSCCWIKHMCSFKNMLTQPKQLLISPTGWIYMFVYFDHLSRFSFLIGFRTFEDIFLKRCFERVAKVFSGNVVSCNIDIVHKWSPKQVVVAVFTRLSTDPIRRPISHCSHARTVPLLYCVGQSAQRVLQDQVLVITNTLTQSNHLHMQFRRCSGWEHVYSTFPIKLYVESSRSFTITC